MCWPHFVPPGQDGRHFNIREALHSSSDGQRFETQINTFNARYAPKYFGLDKGVSACTVVANHFGTQNI